MTGTLRGSDGRPTAPLPDDLARYVRHWRDVGGVSQRAAKWSPVPRKPWLAEDHHSLLDGFPECSLPVGEEVDAVGDLRNSLELLGDGRLSTAEPHSPARRDSGQAQVGPRS